MKSQKSSSRDFMTFSHFESGRFKMGAREFTALGKEWLRGVYADKSVEIFPEIRQHTPKYIEFKRTLYRRLLKVPVIFSKDRFFHSGPEQVLIDWGALQSPIYPPLEDNTLLREAMKLRSPDENEMRLVAQFFNHIVEGGEWNSIHLRRKSSSGFPFFVVGAEIKMEIAKKVFSNLPMFLESTLTDIRKRYRLTNSYPLFSNGIRIQADKVTVEDGITKVKTRYTYPKEVVKRGLREGDVMIPVDSTVRIDGKVVDDIASARVRSMYALTYHDNVVLQALNNYIYHGAKKACVGLNYSGEIELSKVIRAWGGREKQVFSLDKAHFGETFCPIVLELLLDAIRRKFGSLIAEYVRITIDAPTVIRSYNKGEQDVFFSRPNFSKDTTLSLRGTFKSGHGLVSVIGKLLGAVDAMLIARRALGKSFSYDDFLRNSSDSYMYFGSGDDTLFVVKDQRVRERFVDAVESGASLHKDELETGTRFLGYFYTNDGYVQKDMSKFLESITGTERSFRLKKFPRLGVFAKMRQYEVNPLYKDIFDIVNSTYMDFYNFDIKEYVRGQSLTLATADNALFLDRPERMLYMDLKVDPALLAEEYEAVSAESIAASFSKISNL